MRLIFDVEITAQSDGYMDASAVVSTADGETYAEFCEACPAGTYESTIAYILFEIRALLRHHEEVCPKVDHMECCGRKKVLP